MELKGKKALITGASRGIGRAIAIAYAKEGADLVLTARSKDSLTEIVKDVSALKVKAHSVEWDVADVGGIKAKLDTIIELLGGLDIVVNNAGVNKLPPNHPNPSPEALWDYVMNINLKSLYFICGAVGEIMKDQKNGIIINMASDAGMRAAPSPYGISKWGVIGLTKGFASKLSNDGIRVNAIAPGPVATKMMGWEPGKPIDRPNLPLGRFSLPEEIADIAVYLASDRSRAVIGQTIVANTANT